MSPLMRACLSLFAGGVVAALVAITVAIADLYLAGHGNRSLLAPLIVFEPLGVVLGVGDVVMLAAGGAAIIGAWHVMGRDQAERS